MGAWGAGLFQDDVAEDVRAAYRELLGDGLSGQEATDELLRRFDDALSDADDGPVVWVALAATQAKLGRLDARVRDHALAVIRSGRDLDRWEHASERRRRAQVLAKLEADLTGPQRAPVKVRPPRRTTTPLRPGDLASYRLSDGRRLVVLRVLACVGDERDNYPIVDVADWIGTSPPPDVGSRPSRAPRSRIGTEVISLVQHREGEFPADRITILERGLTFPRRTMEPELMYAWSELDKNLERDFGF